MGWRIDLPDEQYDYIDQLLKIYPDDDTLIRLITAVRVLFLGARPFDDSPASMSTPELIDFEQVLSAIVDETGVDEPEGESVQVSRRALAMPGSSRLGIRINSASCHYTGDAFRSL